MHELSANHIDCTLSAHNLCNENGRISDGIEQQLDNSKQYWVNVLCRVVAVIRFLAQRGLPFRRDDELLGSVHNGNFLGILELIAHAVRSISAKPSSKIWQCWSRGFLHTYHPQLLRS